MDKPRRAGTKKNEGMGRRIVTYLRQHAHSLWRNPSVLPGFGVTMGFTLVYLSLIVLLPLAALVALQGRRARAGTSSGSGGHRCHARAGGLSPEGFGASLIAATINNFFGVLVAWILVRYRFPAKRLLDGLVDLPFALPTAVAGIARLATLFAQVTAGWAASWSRSA